MATYYGVNAGGNLSAGATWSTTAAKDGTRTGDGSTPTAADNLILDDYSGNVTIDTASACRSFDCSTYDSAKTLTHNNGANLSIGDATSGLGNKAIDLSGGFTYTLGNVAGSRFYFVSTSATTQTVNFAGKTTGDVNFGQGVTSGKYQYTGGHICGASATVQLICGTLDINGQTCSWGTFNSSNTNTRTLTLGNSSITITGTTATAWTTATATNLTITANTATLTFTGGGSFTPSFNQNSQGLSLVFNLTNATSALSGSGSQTGIASVTVNGNTGGNSGLTLSANYTITGAFTFNGYSTARRCFLGSSSGGTARTISAATVVVTNCDMQDITGAGSGSWDFSAQNDVSNAGGNTSVTFPTGTTQTWSGTSGGNFSANAWTTRIPLLQDTVNVSSSFSASQTITIDVPKVAGINFTGTTGNPALHFQNGGFGTQVFGGFTFVSGMTMGGSSTTVFFVGRGSYSITSAGVSFVAATTTMAAIGGTLTLNDAFVTTGNLSITNGTFISSGYMITCVALLSSATSTRAVTLTTSTVRISSLISFATSTGMTLDASNSTFEVYTASASTRTLQLGSNTVGTLTYTVAGSTGELDITGSNSFAAINFSDVTNARSLKFTAGTTTTIRNLNGFNVQGTVGKLMTVSSITSATHTLTSTQNQQDQYLNLSYSIATGGGAWDAGNTTTDGGNNTGWTFANAPVVVASNHVFGDEGMVS